MSVAPIEVSGGPREFAVLQEISPSVAIGILYAAQILLWTIAPTIANDALPLDVVENGAWGPEWLLSSYKNPALSSWCLELIRLATGSLGWPAYLVSQLFVSATFALVFLLGKEAMGASRALAGTLLLTGVYYFSWPTPEFNQDVAQMPLWAGLALALWRATETDRWIWWLLLALFGAASLYAKLSSSVLLIAAAAWMLADVQARRTLAGPRPWMMLGLFLLLIAPLSRWLIDNGFAPGAYAIARGATHSFSGAGFVLAQAEAAAPAIVILWLAGLLGALSASRHRERNRRFGAYLLTLTIIPILLCILTTGVAGTGARRMWGVPMLNLVGLLAIWLTSSRFTHKALEQIQIAAAALLITLPVAYVTATTLSPELGYVKRQNWPQTEIATRMRDLWTQSTGQPLRIVAGDATNWLSGLIALSCRERPPSLFTDADHVRSPWITNERLTREGALVVWTDRGGGLSQRLADLIGSRPRQVARFSIPGVPAAAPIDVHYAIIQPRVGQ